MSIWLIALVGVIYLAVALEQALVRNFPSAMVFFGYAFSNLGLILLIKNQ